VPQGNLDVTERTFLRVRAGLREEQNPARALAHQDERKGRVAESLFLRLLGTLGASLWHCLLKISFQGLDVELSRPMSMT
jgi:hypothetical protein